MGEGEVEVHPLLILTLKGEEILFPKVFKSKINNELVKYSRHNDHLVKKN
jgi:hypothetical protein